MDYSDAVVLLNGAEELYPSVAEELLAETGIDPEYRLIGMLVLPALTRSRQKGGAQLTMCGWTLAAVECCYSGFFPEL